MERMRYGLDCGSLYRCRLSIMASIIGLLLVISSVSAQSINESKILPDDGSAEDQYGHCIDMSGEYTIVGSWQDDHAGTNSGSAYIYKFNGSEWVEHFKLTPSDAAEGDRFGASVAIDGDFAVVGAVHDDDLGVNSGAAYVFERNGEIWQEFAKLYGEQNNGDENEFGVSVDIDGDRIIVGGKMSENTGPGRAYIFQQDGGNWLLEDKLGADDGEFGDHFGYSVGISGDYAIVGAQVPGEGNGAVYMFEKDNDDDWQNTDKLIAPSSNEYFGWAVGISEDFAIVSAHGNDDAGTDAGAAYIYERGGSEWDLYTQLDGSGISSWSWFGYSVHINGEFATVGAPTDVNFINESGSGYLFRIEGVSWVEEAHVQPDDGEAQDQFGFSAAVDGDYMFFGAQLDDDQGLSSGAAYYYNGVIPMGILGSSPGGMTFGETIVGGSRTREFTVSNSGRDLLVIGPVSLTGADAAQFDLDSEVFVLDPNEQETLEIHFTPGEAGEFEAAIYINSSEEDSWIDLWGDAIEIPAQQPLSASDGESDDGFGRGVDIDGNWAVVSARNEDENGANAGAVYVYRLQDETWIEDVKLTADDGVANDEFGKAVAVSGNTILVGARYDDDGANDAGSAYVYTYDNGIWTQTQKLTANDPLANDWFGFEVDMDGNTAVISSRHADAGVEDVGAAYVFEFDGTDWSQTAMLLADDGEEGDIFGNSVGVSGDRIVVGAKNATAGIKEEAGAAYVYEKVEGVWEQVTKLVAMDGDEFDHFGAYVDIDGDYVISGAREHTLQDSAEGAAYVYKFNGSSWSQHAKLTAHDAQEGDWFGWAVSISGDYALVSATFDNVVGTDRGSAYLFKREDDDWWFSTKFIAEDGEDSDFFGWSVSLDENQAIIGAWEADGNEANSGKAYTFTAFQTVGIDPHDGAEVPTQIELSQNYPNPFNPSTVIEISLPTVSDVSLIVYDVTGRVVSRLIDGQRLAANRYDISWDGTNQYGLPVMSGVYFYQLRVNNDFVQTKRMILIK